MRAIRFAALILVVTPILTACASARRPPAPQPAVPAIADSKLLMTAAPYAQNFVWVEPSAIFAGVTASDDTSGNWGPTEGLKQSIAIPLAEMGWRVTAVDSANFRVAVLYAERTEMVDVHRWNPQASPGTRQPVREPEQTTPRGSPSGPRPTPAPVSQPVQSSVQSYVSRIPVVAQYRAFVIQRMSDGAIYYRIVKGGDQRGAERTFARLVVQLIHQAPTP